MATIEFGGFVLPTFSYFDNVKCHYEKSDPDKLAAFYQILQESAIQFPVKDPTKRDEVNEERTKYVRSKLAVLFVDAPELVEEYDEYLKEVEEKKFDVQGPQVEFLKKVAARFENEPDKLATLYAPYNLAMTQMLADPPTKTAKEAWEDTYQKARASLDGEPDLVQEFELFYQRVKVGMVA